MMMPRKYGNIEITSGTISCNINITIGRIRLREAGKFGNEWLSTTRAQSALETFGQFTTSANLGISLTKSGSWGDVIDVLLDVSWNVVFLSRDIMNTR